MKARPTADFRPVKPCLDPPEPPPPPPEPTPPKPSVRLAGVLRGPDGRTLLNPPIIELDELFEEPLPLPMVSPKMIPSPFKESVAHSTRTATPVRESSFHMPFLYENIPAVENPKTIFERKLFDRHDDPIDRFHSKIDRLEEPQQAIHLPEIPPLPNWERDFDAKPVTVSSSPPSAKSSPSSAQTNLQEFQSNEHFEKIDIFPTRNKMTTSPDSNNDSVQEKESEQNTNTAQNKNTAQNTDIEQNIDIEQKKYFEQKKIILPVIHFVHGNSETVFRRKRSVSVPKKRELPVVQYEKSVNELLRTENLTKSYYRKKLKIPVLRGVNLTVRVGEFVSVIGQSGSGKSTLLHLLGTLDNPESGTVYFEGQRIDNLPIVRRDYLRNRSIGFIFQFYHLLPELTTLENVLSPLMIREGIGGYFFRRGLYLEKAKVLLEKVGLSHRLKHKPCELSGGEMQRAAIARALISEPKILLADEPTGNLDSTSAAEIMELLQHLNKEQKLTIVMVTHDNTIANTADRIVRMVDGVIV
ncbi:MAG: ABC transporter ATP-binding protein [Planctomycetaceae bacterium]|jgi:lipoprotein-releasing system ATP-binding protein|nr:ABC transporter ATP-binding protein [Planctomycetaceae bacterium]